MKRSLSMLLSMLFFICFSLSLSAQSDANELDQVKLLKQWEGTWESIIGEDSTLLFKASPLGNGLVLAVEWKASGKTYYSSAGIMGFINGNKTIVLQAMWENGAMATEYGRFVSETKMVAERFPGGQPNHAVLISETEFVDPNTVNMVYYMRGQNITWEPQGEARWTFTRVEE